MAEKKYPHLVETGAQGEQAENSNDAPRSTFDGGGPTSGDMNERIAKLEARADSMENSLSRIETKLDGVSSTVNKLPTSNGLWGMIATVIAIGLAISALTFVIADYASRGVSG